MVQPVTTTDLLLQEISGKLDEIRDLLQQDHSAQAAKPAAKKTAVKKSAAKRTSK